MPAKFDKFAYYERAVQDPAAMGDFLANVYRDLTGRTAKTLREDFCGTFAVARDWVERDPKNTAVVIDNDPVPLAKGGRHERIKTFRRDVRSPRLPGADILVALNFSYGVFKTRADLRKYLEACRRAMPKRSMIVLDVLGGVESSLGTIDRVQYPDFVYFWEHAAFDPVTRLGRFYIHFQRPGEKRRNRVFTYDWRMWTVPELRDLLEEVGFSRTCVHWQGTEPDGAQSWVAYVIGL